MQIRIKLEDGTILYANGADAQAVWGWLQFCETQVLQRGVAKYAGPRLKRITCITQEPETSLVEHTPDAGR